MFTSRREAYPLHRYNSSNLLRTIGDIVSRMQWTAVDYAAAFRVWHGTAIETGPVVVMRALQKLHALLRRTGTRRRQCRATDNCGDDIVDNDVVRGDVAISQKRVEIMLISSSDRQIINDPGRRRPGRVDATGFPRDNISVALTVPSIVVLPSVKFAQIRLLVASGRPAAALPPSLRAEQRRVSPPRQARHASSSSCTTNDDKRATTSGSDRRRRRWSLRSISTGSSLPSSASLQCVCSGGERNQTIIIVVARPSNLGSAPTGSSLLRSFPPRYIISLLAVAGRPLAKANKTTLRGIGGFLFPL